MPPFDNRNFNNDCRSSKTSSNHDSIENNEDMFSLTSDLEEFDSPDDGDELALALHSDDEDGDENDDEDDHDDSVESTLPHEKRAIPVLPEPNDVCFKSTTWTGSKVWREVVKSFSENTDDYPIWKDSICQSVKEQLRREHNVRRFLISLDNEGQPSKKIGTGHWHLAHGKEILAKTKYRFEEDRKERSKKRTKGEKKKIGRPKKPPYPSWEDMVESLSDLQGRLSTLEKEMTENVSIMNAHASVCEIKSKLEATLEAILRYHHSSSRFDEPKTTLDQSSYHSSNAPTDGLENEFSECHITDTADLDCKPKAKDTSSRQDKLLGHQVVSKSKPDIDRSAPDNSAASNKIAHDKMSPTTAGSSEQVLASDNNLEVIEPADTVAAAATTTATLSATTTATMTTMNAVASANNDGKAMLVEMVMVKLRGSAVQGYIRVSCGGGLLLDWTPLISRNTFNKSLFLI